MRKLICLLIFPMLVQAQDSKPRNGLLSIGSYGIGEGKGTETRQMAFTFSTGLGYEIYLNDKISLTPGFRHGTNRFNYSQEGADVFVRNRFFEPNLMGRRYFLMGSGTTLFLGAQAYGRRTRQRVLDGVDIDRTDDNVGWNFGFAFGGGARFYLQPRAYIEVGLTESYDLFESYKREQDEFRLNQVSLNVGLFVAM